MSLVVSQTGPAGRVSELALWSVAGLLMLSVHIGAGLYLMRTEPSMPSENAPPAAIMIELAPEPVAANTEEDQVSPDMQDLDEVKSDAMEPVEEPVEEPQPELVEQAQPEPMPEPVIEQPQEEPPPPEVAEQVEPPPEPVMEEPQEMPEPEPPPEPVPEVAETMPEPPPEPIEEIDPIEQQTTAALENVEVPLPMMRPLPPPVAEKPLEQPKKIEPKKQPVKKVVQKPKQQQQQAQREMAQAKLQTTQADRTAASQNSTGLFAPSVSPAKWKSRVQAKLARNARKCPGGGAGTAAVRFNFDGGGNVTSVSLSRSSGDSAIDDYIVSAVRRASPIPAPPSGVASYLDQALTCLR